MRTLLMTIAGGCVGCVLTLALLEHQPIVLTGAQAQPSRPAPSILPPQGAAPPASPSVNTDEALTPEERINVKVYEKCNRSVVNISTLTVRPDRWMLFEVPAEGSGSGSVLDRAGHILTNYHVIEDARQVAVTLFNEETYVAQLVGADPVNDIAVIKIDAPAEQLFPISLGSSEALRVGLRVFALGNPFGLNRTMSTGIIASLNRSLQVRDNWVIKSIIQIDASINPGSSGGPLLDSNGLLIGMNTAIATASSQQIQQSAGIGFSIPVALIRRVVPELIQHGRVIRGEIGISHVSEIDGGLRVVQLTPGGPAEQAGLRGPRTNVERQGRFEFRRTDWSRADIIVAVDGDAVSTAAEFLEHIESKKPGNVVQLTIVRQGQTMTVDITLGGDAPAGQKPPALRTPI